MIKDLLSLLNQFLVFFDLPLQLSDFTRHLIKFILIAFYELIVYKVSYSILTLIV